MPAQHAAARNQNVAGSSSTAKPIVHVGSHIGDERSSGMHFIIYDRSLYEPLLAINESSALFRAGRTRGRAHLSHSPRPVERVVNNGACPVVQGVRVLGLGGA